MFHDFTIEEMSLMATCFNQRAIADGETICKQGTVGTSFFLLTEGKVRVSVDGEELATLQNGTVSKGARRPTAAPMSLDRATAPRSPPAHPLKTPLPLAACALFPFSTRVVLRRAGAHHGAAARRRRGGGRGVRGDGNGIG